jgi:hypothetical protein
MAESTPSAVSGKGAKYSCKILVALGIGVASDGTQPVDGERLLSNSLDTVSLLEIGFPSWISFWSTSINDVAYLALKKKPLQSLLEMAWNAALAAMSNSLSVRGA